MVVLRLLLQRFALFVRERLGVCKIATPAAIPAPPLPVPSIKCFRLVDLTALRAAASF